MQRKAFGGVLRKLDDDVQEWDETFLLGSVMSSNGKGSWGNNYTCIGEITVVLYKSVNSSVRIFLFVGKM